MCAIYVIVLGCVYVEGIGMYAYVCDCVFHVCIRDWCMCAHM